MKHPIPAGMRSFRLFVKSYDRKKGMKHWFLIIALLAVFTLPAYAKQLEFADEKMAFVTLAVKSFGWECDKVLKFSLDREEVNTTEDQSITVLSFKCETPAGIKTYYLRELLWEKKDFRLWKYKFCHQGDCRDF